MEINQPTPYHNPDVENLGSADEASISSLPDELISAILEQMNESYSTSDETLEGFQGTLSTNKLLNKKTVEVASKIKFHDLKKLVNKVSEALKSAEIAGAEKHAEELHALLKTSKILSAGSLLEVKAAMGSMDNQIVQVLKDLSSEDLTKVITNKITDPELHLLFMFAWANQQVDNFIDNKNNMPLEKFIDELSPQLLLLAEQKKFPILHALIERFPNFLKHQLFFHLSEELKTQGMNVEAGKALEKAKAGLAIDAANEDEIALKEQLTSRIPS